MVAETKPLFDLGQVVATPRALAAMEEAGDSPSTFLRRHHVGDWGDVCDEDKALNDEALKDGSRLLSSYKTGGNNGTKLWVITEAKDGQGRRAATTLLLPEEY